MDPAEELAKPQGDFPEETGQKPGLDDDMEATAQPKASGEGQVQCHDLLWETLARQFLEYEQAASFLIPEEQQRRLLCFLPLFLKVCSSAALGT